MDKKPIIYQRSDIRKSQVFKVTPSTNFEGELRQRVSCHYSGEHQNSNSGIQLVFLGDVCSRSFRRALELQDYAPVFGMSTGRHAPVEDDQCVQKTWLNRLNDICVRWIYLLKLHPIFNRIDFGIRCAYAKNILNFMGLTKNFATLVVFFKAADLSHSQEIMLMPEKCGVQQGYFNARILVDLLNQKRIRKQLKTRGILISDRTRFMLAEHHALTDEVTIDEPYQTEKIFQDQLRSLRGDLLSAQKLNQYWQAQYTGRPG